MCLQSHGLTEDHHDDTEGSQERWRDADVVSVSVRDVF